MSADVPTPDHHDVMAAAARVIDGALDAEADRLAARLHALGDAYTELGAGLTALGDLLVQARST